MHAYDLDGLPVYEVPNASKGGMRSTTIADCRKLGLVPSVTEITGQLDKPALLTWKIDKVLQQCILDRYPGNYVFDEPADVLNNEKAYKGKILRNVAVEAAKAPAIGSEIHDELEQWYKAGANTPPSDRISRAVFAVREQVGKFDYVAEKSFCHPLGFGGKVDLHCDNGAAAHFGLEGDTPGAIVLDFKTKDTLDIKKFKGYKEHIMQLAAYRHGLGIPDADCYNLFISSQDTTLVKLVQYKEEELTQAWEMFKCLLKFWQVSNNMEVKV